MSVFDVLKQQYVEIIDWVEKENGVLAYQFPLAKREIPSGAQLTVRESQLAIFLNEGEIADIFEPGRYRLTTKTLPRLAILKQWDSGFASPFKSDIFFFSTREQLDQKWGTATPVTVRDRELGPLRLRAHGSYSYRVKNPKVFFQKISGTSEKYTVEALEGQLRSCIIAAIGHFFGNAQVAFIDMASNQMEFSAALKKGITQAFTNYGLSLESFLVEGISLPEELQGHFDKAISMRLVGDLNKYLLFQAAETLAAAGSQGQGLQGMGQGIGEGIGAAIRQAAGVSSSAQSAQGKPGEKQLSSGKPAAEDLVATLGKLHDLFKQGVLTQAEFEAKKAELLKKIGTAQ